MQNSTFVVIDSNYRTRHELVRALGTMAYVVPADSLEELGGRWPEQGWLLVHDTGTQVADTQRALREAGQYLPVVPYSQGASIAHVMDALSAGAAGYLEWPSAHDALQRSLETIMARKWQGSATSLAQARAKQRIDLLSPREKEVLTSVCEGYSSREVARTLGISPRTVELHRANVLTKLGVRNVAAAVKLSVEARFESAAAEMAQSETSEMAA